MERKWARCIVPVSSTEMDFLEHDFRQASHKSCSSLVRRHVLQYRGFYWKIEPEKRLTYPESFADKKGNLLSGPQIGFGYDFPLEREVDITFEHFEDGTRIKLIHRGLPANGHSDKSATETGK